MSTRSRLLSHQDEASPNLLHNSLGSYNPLALQLEVSRIPDEDSGDSADSATFLSALTHERHHWLQSIGTCGGIFHQTLLWAQAQLVAEIVVGGELRAEDLPLLSNSGRYVDELASWERIEATRRLYFGCRRYDFEVLLNDNRVPFYSELNEFLYWMHDVLIWRSESNWGKSRWWDHRGKQPPRDRPYYPEAEGGWLLGARHLMELSARQTELFSLVDKRLRWPDLEYGRIDLFTGIYGVARKDFIKHLGLESDFTTAHELALSFACDSALQGLLPPAAGLTYETVDWLWAPGMRFRAIIDCLKGFDFRRKVDIYNPLDVQSFLAELSEHVRSRQSPITDKFDWGPQMMLASLKHLNLDVCRREVGHEAEQTLGGPSAEPPSELYRGSGQRYMYAVGAEALRLRRKNPENFCFPTSLYLSDRSAFRSLFDKIQPPLMVWGESGISPTSAVPGWWEYFFLTGVQHELLRSIVMFDIPTVARRLLPFIRSPLGREHGLESLRGAISRTFTERSGIGSALWKQITDS